MNAKTAVIIGGILLLVGAMTPWATLSTSFLGISRSFYGYESDGLITGGAGLIILILALATKPRPGKVFSIPVVLIAIVAGIVAVLRMLNIYVSTSQVTDVQSSIGYGLSCLTPLGLAFSFFGGSIREKTPAPAVPPAAPTAL